MDSDEELELYAAMEAVVHQRARVAAALSFVVSAEPEVVRRLRGLDSEELLELADLACQAYPGHASRSVLEHASRELRARDEVAALVRQELTDQRQGLARRERARRTMLALQRGDERAWVEHLRALGNGVSSRRLGC